MVDMISKTEAFEKLGPLNALLFESVDTSVLFANEHFKASKHRYEAQFFATHVR